MCTFVWTANGIQRGHEVQQYQNALIEDVFGYTDRKLFLNQLSMPTEVETFNGEYSGYITEDFLKKLVTRIMIVGPLAAIFGRCIEQEIMKGTCKYFIKESEFEYSLRDAKVCLKLEHLVSDLGEAISRQGTSEASTRT